MFLLYGPTLLLQQLFSNIFISGIINGLSQFATIPFLPVLNKNVSRRKGLMAMFALTALFTLAQYIVDPSGCIGCTRGVSSVLIFVFFFVARFFINLNSNFYLNTINESFAAQIRPICYCGAVGMARLSTLTIPYIPILNQSLGISYNLLFAFMGLLGVVSSYTLR